MSWIVVDWKYEVLPDADCKTDLSRFTVQKAGESLWKLDWLFSKPNTKISFIDPFDTIDTNSLWISYGFNLKNDPSLLISGGIIRIHKFYENSGMTLFSTRVFHGITYDDYSHICFIYRSCEHEFDKVIDYESPLSKLKKI